MYYCGTVDEEDERQSLEWFAAFDRYIEGEDPGNLPLVAMEASGWKAPDPQEVLDADLLRTLTDLVWALNDLGFVLSDTDHLSDRELYEVLFEMANEPTYLCPEDTAMTIHFSPIGGCSEEDLQIGMRFYWDEEQREDWRKRFPEDAMPLAELPPYPRSWIPEQRIFKNALDPE
jgi:hypothetical protein